MYNEAYIQEYTEEKGNDPPPLPLSDLADYFLERQGACVRFAQDLDFQFMKAVTTEKDVPEYNGYMAGMLLYNHGLW